MKWIKRQWKTNSNFRAAVVLVAGQALVGAGAPVALVKGVQILLGAVSF